MECPSGNVGCILSYNGDLNSCVINYAVFMYQLVVNSLYFWLTHPNDKLDANNRTICVIWQCVALAIVIAYQVVLCIFLGCSGISIVWNVMVGFILRDLCQTIRTSTFSSTAETSETSVNQANQKRKKNASLFVASCAPAFAADLYYAITADFITTVAHICALVLGCLIASLYHCFLMKRTVQPTSTTEGVQETSLLTDHLAATN
jgi:hypothetical protein